MDLETKLHHLGALVALSLALNGYASADIFRCQQPSGEVIFQDTKCAAKDSRPITLRPLNILGEPLREAERELLVNQTGDRPSNKRGKSRNSRQFEARRRSAERCFSKRQKLAAVGAKLRRGYKPAQGERLRRKRDDYAAYLRRFCE